MDQNRIGEWVRSRRYRLVWVGLCVLLFVSSMLMMVCDRETYIGILTRWFATGGEIEHLRRALLLVNWYLFLLAALSAVVLLYPPLSVDCAITEFRSIAAVSQRGEFLSIGILCLIYLATRLSPSAYMMFYIEDGVLESMTAVLSIAAGVIFILLAGRRSERELRGFFILLGILSLLFGFEEISWGQRIFGWETPDAYAAINCQKETTLHNIANPLFVAAYRFFTFGGFLVFLSMKPLAKRLRSWRIGMFFSRYYVKQSCLYGILWLCMFATTVFGRNRTEFTEQVVAVMLFFLALRARWPAVRDGQEPYVS
ncbi:MAG: hypothetical protein K9M84_11315 [Spirochaetia bacterium]|nr:hypothetical protein [Spirochaetia bacterium]